MAPVIARGQGCHVWDIDGNRFIELGSGVRSVTLGHGYKPVCDAASLAMQGGTNFSRPGKIELDAAEALLNFIPNADMVKFAKNGSDATSAAVRLSRAVTGREKVALCGDQPFFSVDDWFICTTPMDAGIPSAASQLTLTFRFNQIDDLKSLFEKHPGEIACVIMEAHRDVAPEPGYLQAVRELVTRNGAILIFDEIVAGFRLHAGGGQALHNVAPDLSTWGKAMANGFALAALSGRRELMERGGIMQSKHDRVFLLSTTNGAETHALAACIATIEAYRSRDVVGHIRYVGEQVRDGFNQIVHANHIQDYLHTAGHPGNLVFVTKDPDHNKSQSHRTLFMQELLKRGVLAPSLVVNDAFEQRDIDHLLWAVSETAEIYKRALENGIGSYLEARPVKPVFRKSA